MSHMVVHLDDLRAQFSRETPKVLRIQVTRLQCKQVSPLAPTDGFHLAKKSAQPGRQSLDVSLPRPVTKKQMSSTMTGSRK